MTMTSPQRPDVGDAPRLPAVVAHDVHLEYKVYAETETRQSVRDFFGSGFQKRETRLVHALRGVSLTIHPGEAVGIIGSNGSGKSTLLRAIASVLPVTSGELITRGEAALLGVHAALKPQLSGRRNIYLGCLAMGMRLDEVEELVPSLVDFTELGEAIDRPMRTYSSGMQARLHFAIATAKIPDILLVDEALAVGDRGFAEKSKGKIAEVIDQAGTVIVVSHNLAQLSELCPRGIWLERGELRSDGKIADVIEEYEAMQ